MSVTAADVANRWRPLTTEETTVAGTLLAVAEAIVNTRYPTLADVVADDDSAALIYTDVVSWMVIRRLQNPEGLTRFQIGDYSGARDGASLGLYLSDEAGDDLAQLLGTSTGAFTITPYYAVPE